MSLGFCYFPIFVFWRFRVWILDRKPATDMFSFLCISSSVSGKCYGTLTCNFLSFWCKALNDLHDLPSWLSVIDEAISIVHYAASKLSGERDALGSASNALAQSNDCIGWRESFLRHLTQIIRTHTYLGTCIKYTHKQNIMFQSQHSWRI
jgi:hypothetical protein